MPVPVIAAGVTAAASIGGALLSSHSASSAANTAVNAQTQASAQQLQLGREQMGLNRDIYNSNYAMLSPFVSRGDVAGQSINALLGLPTAPTMTSPLATASGGAGGGGASGAYTGPDLNAIMAMQHDGIPGNYRAALAAYNAAHSGPQANAPATAGTPATPTSPGTTPAAPAVTPLTATQAYENFANSAGIKSSMDALQQNYAAKGLLQSGAAMKGVQQNAMQNFFLPYLGLLGGQQSVGAQAGSAVAGVGSNFGNTAAAISGQMGNAIQNGADATSNAALVRGANQANIYNSLGSSLGNIAGSLFHPSAAPYIPNPGIGGASTTVGAPPLPSLSYPMPNIPGYGY